MKQQLAICLRENGEREHSAHVLYRTAPCSALCCHAPEASVSSIRQPSPRRSRDPLGCVVFEPETPCPHGHAPTHPALMHMYSTPLCSMHVVSPPTQCTRELSAETTTGLCPFSNHHHYHHHRHHHHYHHHYHHQPDRCASLHISPGGMASYISPHFRACAKDPGGGLVVVRSL